LNVKRPSQEYTVQLEGNNQIFATTEQLLKGVEPFGDVKIKKLPINKLDESKPTNEYNSNESGEDGSDDDLAGSIKLSKCLIRISPERNLMAPNQNSEKVMFFQKLLDEYGLKFEESLDLVTISGKE
jgi:hypothetical protein